MANMTLEQAMMQSSLWDIEEYRANKDLFDERFLKMGNTEEARNVLLDYISGKRKKIELDDIARKNASVHLNDRVSHGFYTFGDGGWGVNNNKGLSKMDVISRNIDTVMSNKNVELAMSGDAHRLGDIGVVGKADITGYFPRDISSKLGENGMRVSALRGSAIVDDIMDEGIGQTYSEYFGKNFQVDALWVRDSFLQDNQDDIVKILQKHNIENVEIVSGNASYSPEYTPKSTNIQRIKASDLYEKVKQSSPIDIEEPIHPSKAIDETFGVVQNKPRTKRYKPAKGRKLKVKNNLEYNSNVSKPKKYQSARGKKFKQAKIVRKNTVKNPTSKGNHAGPKTLSKKTLSGGGKLAIGLAIAGAVVGGIIVASNDSSKSKNKKKETKQVPINNQRLEDSYAIQMAKDISSYRYGKHMTGFVNP